MADRRIVTIVSFVGTVAVLFSMANADQPTRLANTSANEVRWHKDLESAWETSQQQKRPMLVLVSMPNCPYCTRIKQETFTNDQLVSNINSDFIAVSVSAKEADELVKRVGIRLFPTTLIISSEAEVLDHVKGYVSADKMQRHLTAATARVASVK